MRWWVFGALAAACATPGADEDPTRATAPWGIDACASTRAPEHEELYQAYRDDGFVVVTLLRSLLGRGGVLLLHKRDPSRADIEAALSE